MDKVNSIASYPHRDEVVVDLSGEFVKYDHLADLKKLSQQMAVDFSGIEANIPVLLLQEFRHIAEKIAGAWGSNEATPYMDRLMFADRLDRAGFSPSAIAELFFLRQLHEFLYSDCHAGQKTVEELMHRNIAPRNLYELVARYGIAKSATLRRSQDPMADSPLRPCGWGEIGTAGNLLAAALTARNVPAMRFGEILVKYGVVSEYQCAQVLDQQLRATGEHRLTGELMRANKIIDEDDIVKAICHQSGFLLVDLDAIAMTSEAVSKVSREIAHEFSVIPLLCTSEVLVLVVEEPLLLRSHRAVEMLAKKLELSILVAWAPAAAIARRLLNYSPGRIEKRI